MTEDSKNALRTFFIEKSKAKKKRRKKIDTKRQKELEFWSKTLRAR